MVDVATELSGFFELTEFEPETLNQYADAIFATARSRERFAELTREQRAAAERDGGNPLAVGVALYLLGEYRDAIELLARSPAGKYRSYYSGRCALALGRLDQAVKDYQAAASKGWDEFETDMQIAAIHVRQGDAAAAEKVLKQRQKAGEDRGEWYYVKGLICESEGDRVSALEAYDRALALDPHHADCIFRAAYLHDMAGDDERAVELYERVALQPRSTVNALINLAVLYEDTGRYNEAVTCLRRVLALHPNHTRARLFLKDVESSREMVIEDGGEKRADTRSRLLDTPINDFELSVRARNCLKKMKINTLGDLLKLTEAELLAYKNFGETSLQEIRALLSKRGLRLGQAPEEIDATVIEQVAPPRPAVPPGSEAILAKPVSELELSVRARRCLQRLNISTLGDLIQHTEHDLLSTRNFGVTSLNEIKARLADHGLSLAPKV